MTILSGPHSGHSNRFHLMSRAQHHSAHNHGRWDHCTGLRRKWRCMTTTELPYMVLYKRDQSSPGCGSISSILNRQTRCRPWRSGRLSYHRHYGRRY